MSTGSPYSSGASYGSYVNGTQNQQYARVFSQGGQYGEVKGNAMIGAQGQKAGRRRRTRKLRKGKKRGGNISSIVGQALPPLTLLAMQQSYKKKNGYQDRFQSRNRSRRYR
jgi:hypothetical protein